jgi:hypothetical protein
MSVAEIKKEIEQLSPQEREEVAQFLRAKQLAESPEYRARVERAHRQIEDRRVVTLEQLKKLVAKNQAAARRAS